MLIQPKKVSYCLVTFEEYACKNLQIVNTFLLDPFWLLFRWLTFEKNLNNSLMALCGFFEGEKAVVLLVFLFSCR